MQQSWKGHREAQYNVCGLMPAFQGNQRFKTWYDLAAAFSAAEPRCDEAGKKRRKKNLTSALSCTGL